MNDIRRPRPRQPAPAPAPAPTQRPMIPAPQEKPQLKLEAPAPTPLLTPKKRRHVLRWVLLGCAAAIVAAALGAFLWYRLEMRPVNPQDTSQVRITIPAGMAPSSIADLLQSKGLIRNKLVFDIYTRLTGDRSKLQAGTYSISASESLESVVNDLVSGKVDKMTITFLPGATVADDKKVLLKAGYSQAAIDEAFAKQYSHPLFATKPAGTDLEGYIYGDTYSFTSDATVEQILTRTFEEFYATVQDHKLADGFTKQGLSLYQGITLASIIQKEVSGTNDERQVAQIFLRRLQINMPLGSDVTYHYAAAKMGVDPSPSLDSPYNTRRYGGLPPGPISTPGITALDAVANPATGDYLYFLSGDDGKTYYARTAEEHQANIEQHCKIKCSIP
ncbi:MAG TPA: endolytic transglycosylase MltG [Candidatus Saccharimonadales bacterium]